MPKTAVLATLLLTALLLAGVVSLLASPAADGLEASLQPHHYGQEAIKQSSAPVAAAEGFHHKLSPLPDYNAPATAQASSRWLGLGGWTSLAGVIGTIATLSVLYLVTLILRRRRSTCTTRT